MSVNIVTRDYFIIIYLFINLSVHVTINNVFLYSMERCNFVKNNTIWIKNKK